MTYAFEVNGDLESYAKLEGVELFADYDEALGGRDLRSLGVDPATPTGAKPGSEEKVLMLAARYAAGMPLWHDDDCYDHGPGGDDFETEDAYEDEDD
jgi:hypothetical protein